MPSTIGGILFRVLSKSERVGSMVARNCLRTRKLRKMLQEEEIPKLCPALLRVMDLFFCLSRDYHRNIENFEGQYLFDTRDGEFSAGVIFSDGYLRIPEGDMLNPDVRITFANPRGLLQFILCRQEDILDLLLENRMDIKGNVNLGLKFWYMVKELKQRLGLET